MSINGCHVGTELSLKVYHFVIIFMSVQQDNYWGQEKKIVWNPVTCPEKKAQEERKNFFLITVLVLPLLAIFGLKLVPPPSRYVLHVCKTLYFTLPVLQNLFSRPFWTGSDGKQIPNYFFSWPDNQWQFITC